MAQASKAKDRGIVHVHAYKRCRAPRLARALSAVPARDTASAAPAPAFAEAHNAEGAAAAQPVAFSVCSRGHTLAAQLLLPAAGAPKGVAVFLHGLAEHSGRKRTALQALADVAGVAVAAVDLHGHGLSEPREAGLRGVVRSYLHLVEDARALISALRDPGGPAGRTAGALQGLPLFIGGYSMGAGAALHTVLQSVGAREQVAGAFLVSPALGVRKPQTLVERIQLWAGEFLNARLPLWRAVDELPLAALNADPLFLEDYAADPLVVRGRIAVCTVHSILTAAALLKSPEAAAQLSSTPIYIVASEGDRITPAGDVREFVAALRAAGNADVRLDMLPGDRHDLLSGRDGPANAAGAAKFIAERLAPRK